MKKKIVFVLLVVAIVMSVVTPAFAGRKPTAPPQVTSITKAMGNIANIKLIEKAQKYNKGCLFAEADLANAWMYARQDYPNYPMTITWLKRARTHSWACWRIEEYNTMVTIPNKGKGK